MPEQTTFALIIIGTELLTGKRSDGHFAKMRELFQMRGLDISQVTYVVDEPERLTKLLRAAIAGDDQVFCFGGIGATPDDYTRAVAARAADLPLVRHPEAAAIIEQRFGETAYPQRIRMADLPEGCTLIANPINRVPGFSLYGRLHFVPGFPQMAWPMVEQVLDKRPRRRGRQKAPPVETLLTVPNSSEGQLFAIMEDFVKAFPDVQFSCLPHMQGDYRETEFGVRGRAREILRPVAWLRKRLRTDGFAFTESAADPRASRKPAGTKAAKKPIPASGTSPYQRGFLKWAGSKYKVLRNILPRLPAGKRLIEPFAGSAVVSINADYPGYLINDVNPDVIAVYREIARDVESFIAELKPLFTPENNQRDRYFALRDEFNACPPSRRRALLFVYLNRHCFNGLTRYNSKGGFNVPFGRYKSPVLTADSMRAFSTHARRATFRLEDFRTIFEQAQPGDVIYADPPYVPLTDTAYFTKYSIEGFSIGDQRDLARCARETARRGVPVLISNHDTPLTRDLYHDAEMTHFDVTRNISCKVDERGAAGELLALFTPR